MQSTLRITRRGFRNAPASVRERAERHVADFAEATGTDRILATLRPAVYCGPGSAGERGSYTLSVQGGAAHSLHTVEA